ncbi:ZIP family metal transporter [Patescibacteria group bacterium]|nr:MAG: ZIP family metal transporter [Patescibacteria group bacterium]
MDINALYALLATTAVSLIAVLVIVAIPQRWVRQHELYFLSFAGGVLLTSSILQFVPEAIEANPGSPAPLYAALFGFVTFFYLDRLFSRLHHHPQTDDGSGHPHKDHVRPAGWLVVVGDGLHNLVDGIAIAIAFLADPALGFAATLAIAAHEIPQEVADYAILTKAGMSKMRALVLNGLSGLTAVLGAVMVILVGEITEPTQGLLLGLAAGMFLYIAAADIIPDLQHRRHSGGKLTLPFLVGIGTIVLISVFMPHTHGGEGQHTLNIETSQSNEF